MLIADFHIHSRYSRATSKDLDPVQLTRWAQIKGLDLIGTGDFTHPAWRQELADMLAPCADHEGLYQLKAEHRGITDGGRPVRFAITGEISSIYKKNGKVRKVHSLILLPSLDAAQVFSKRLEAVGNLHSDGRPILGLDCHDLLEMLLEACPDAVLIPAHIWTPHFSLFGAYSGFDTIEECFEDLTPYLFALETGLSSDPPMNDRVSALDRYTLISNSDAHSPSKLGREANLFDTPLSYPAVVRAMRDKSSGGFRGTIEFYPEEGKYHYDGHRSCGVCLSPEETKRCLGICPVCGGRITLGVLHRTEELSDRPRSHSGQRPFERCVPLPEIIAELVGSGPASKAVAQKYDALIRTFGSEFAILRDVPVQDLDKAGGPLFAEAIRRLRCGQVEASPGFDGQYGKINLFRKEDTAQFTGQIGLFDESEDADSRIERACGCCRGQSRAKNRGNSHVPDASLTQDETKKAQDAVPLPAAPSEHPSRRKTAAIFFDGLNEAQNTAVASECSALAVSAGPGSGKTRTLINRIAYWITVRKTPAEQITTVTFTHKAAEEMRERLKGILPGRKYRDIHIGTFHSLCRQLLSNRYPEIDLIDSFSAQMIAEEAWKACANLSERPDAVNDAQKPKTLSSASAAREISRIQNLLALGADFPEDAKISKQCYDKYHALKKAYGVWDYDDLQITVLDLCRSDPAFFESVKLWFRYLFVDEFQDVSPLQYALLGEWAKASAGVFAIGDPDQAIYSFRGADAKCFSRFVEDRPDTVLIRLSENYRSTPEILSCASAVIAQNHIGDEANLHPNCPPGDQVHLVQTKDAFSEALFVVKTIGKLIGGLDMLDTEQPLPQQYGTRLRNGTGKPILKQSDRNHGRTAAKQRALTDIAILYRTHRQAALLEECLRKEGIPYSVAGQDEILSDREIRKAVALLCFMADPSDLFSLRQYLTFAAKTDRIPGDRLFSAYQSGPYHLNYFLSLFDSNSPIFEHSPQREEWKNGYAALLSAVETAKPADCIDRYARLPGKQDAEKLERLRSMAVCYRTLDTFLHAVRFGEDSEILRCGGKNYQKDSISLMTLHAAKGLEFPVVFLCGARDGLVPFIPSHGTCDLEEERRLFYVGITRAKEELYIVETPPVSPFTQLLPEQAVSLETFVYGDRPKEKQISLF